MAAKNKTYRILLFVTALVISFLSAAAASHAESACSKVQIEIMQELTLERIAFDAKMVITNNVPDKDLTDINVEVTIRDSAGNVQDSIFFSKITSMQNIDAVDGTGVVQASTAGEIHWLIIPSPGAGGNLPTGNVYWVGATLTYTMGGKQETINVNPDRIIVKPEPQLVLDYFTPYEVLGDNPFTPQVEAPVPYPLAVRVLNEGYGPATKLKIDSAQPKIVENTQGLLVDFKLLGAAVNDSPVSPSLTLELGDVGSKQAATGYWEMISTLSGHITEFKVTFSHASELGGELTSLIKETNTHYLIRRVKVNLPGRDNLLDFLADSDGDPDHFPDTIFESEIPNSTGKTGDAQSPVTVEAVVTPPARPTSAEPEVLMTLQTGTTGWVYAKTPDPAQGLLNLLDVVRADGVHLDPNNFWIQEGLDKDYQRIFTLHILDYRADASAPGTYTLVYTQPDYDDTPPSTKIVFDGPSTGADPSFFITPATRIVLVSSDNDGGSGVDQMFKKVVGIDADFVPAYPFELEVPGTYALEYYGLDRAGNEEAVKTATIVVDNGAPEILAFQASPPTISPHAPRGVAAARTTEFTVRATDVQETLQATIDIAKGEAFAPTAVVRAFKKTLTKDADTSVVWDGKDSVGTLVPTGVYTVRLSVTDGLDSTAAHVTTTTITVAAEDWFTGQPLDPNVSGAQEHPKVSGTQVVWQDNRSGTRQIYAKDTFAGASVAITTGSSDKMYPAIDNNIIVWQEYRNGSWDIYGYDLLQQQGFAVSTETGNQERPVVSGGWVVWQDNRDGNWDIFAKSLANGGAGDPIQITSHVRDQMHPVIAGSLIAWEDYRHGLGEIYTYDLANQTESRYTVEINNQTLPAISGTSLVWTDQRNGQRDIYFSSVLNNEARITYGAGDHSQATLLDGVIVYTDYEAGIGDPNLSFYDTASGIGSILTGNPARQEEPDLGNGVLVWQDDRDGVSQIYWSPFEVEAVPIAADIKPGLNLIAIGGNLSEAYPTTSLLMGADLGGITIDKIVAYGSQDGTFMDTSAGADIALQKGMAIGLYAASSGSLEVAESGETRLYTLFSGMNYVGMLTVPNGYTAYSMLESIGLEAVQSVRRFNNVTGSWETASVRDLLGNLSPAGVDFVIRQGDGLIVTMKSRVDGWKP